jgi:hypothetical protein
MNGRRLQAASPLVPGPGSRALPAEIMRRLLLPGPVWPTGLGFPWRLPFLVGATGGRPIGPTHPAEADRSPQEKGSPGRCFLRATPLTPGHNLSMPERPNIASPPAEPRAYPEAISPNFPLLFSPPHFPPETIAKIPGKGNKEPESHPDRPRDSSI